MDISILTNIENISRQQNAVKIFPNPAKDNISIRSDLKIEQLIIYNQMGQLVYQTQPTDNTLNVDVSDLEHGIYFIRVQTNEGAMLQKIVVE